MTHAAALESLSRDGYCQMPRALDAAAASNLLDAVMATRRFDESLFLSETEWDNGPKSHRGTNPSPGQNVIERFPEKLAFIETAEALRPMLTALLGEGYRFVPPRIVCRFAWDSVPDWLKRRVRGKPCNTFGAFMQPKHRDVMYFLDNEVHQDILDWNRLPPDIRDHRYVTLYVYLGDVTAADAPVNLLPRSHVLGATPFQHDVRWDEAKQLWIYRDGRGRQVEGTMAVVTGTAGHVGVWHNLLIHGGPPIKSGHFRLSLRYLVLRSPTAKTCLLDEINRGVDGPLFLDQDFSAGANASADGMWGLRMSDFIRRGYERQGITP